MCISMPLFQVPSGRTPLKQAMFVWRAVEVKGEFAGPNLDWLIHCNSANLHVAGD